jgi:hypothetical protein
MAKKQNIDALLRKYLGKERATRVIRMIKTMVKAGASPTRIQEVIASDLAARDAVILVKVIKVTGTRFGRGVLTPGAKK